MGISVDTRHALKNSLGEKSGNEVIRLLDRLADELKAEVAFKKAKKDKAAENIAATALKLDEVLVDPQATVAEPSPVQPPLPPVLKAVAPATPVIRAVTPVITSPPAPVADDSSELDAPV